MSSTPSMPSKPRRRLWRRVGLLAAAGLILLAHWPVTTRQGINGVVREYRLPLYQKAVGLWYRDREIRRLVNAIIAGARTPTERADRLWRWMETSLYAGIPHGVAIVDDHIWHIIIRGYGTDDQLADVFAALCTYAGIPAKWFWVAAPQQPQALLCLVFLRLDGQWRVCDPYHHVRMLRPDGAWATVHEVTQQPAIIDAAAGHLTWRDLPYPAYFVDLDHRVDWRRISRNEIQSPWARLVDAILHIAGQRTQ